MKLAHIRDVVAVARCGGLRQAARQLGLTQPAMTRSIREVERELGAPLFDRVAQGVIPTRIGEAFIRRAAWIEAELARARDEVAQLRGEGGGTVAIGLSTVPHLALLPRVLNQFRARFPDAVLTIEEGLFTRMQGSLEDGHLDFYVGPLTEADPPPSLLVETLFENHRIVFCRKGHPMRAATSLAELTDASWITTSVTIQRDAELGPLFARHGLPAPRIRMHAQSALTMVLSAAHSDLLTMLPQQWLAFPAIPALLDHIEVAELLPAPTMRIVRRKSLPLTPAAEFLADMVRRAATNLRVDALR